MMKDSLSLSLVPHHLMSVVHIFKYTQGILDKSCSTPSLFTFAFKSKYRTQGASSHTRRRRRWKKKPFLKINLRRKTTLKVIKQRATENMNLNINFVNSFFFSLPPHSLTRFVVERDVILNIQQCDDHLQKSLKKFFFFFKHFFKLEKYSKFIFLITQVPYKNLFNHSALLTTKLVTHSSIQLHTERAPHFLIKIFQT